MRSLNYFISTARSSKDAQILKSLAVRYGQHLERLDNESKLGLAAALTRYLYLNSLMSEYSIIDGITDTFVDLSEDICMVLLELQGLSVENINALIELARVQQTNTSLVD